MFVRLFLAVTFILWPSVSMANEDITTEEYVLMEHMLSLQSGLAYDEFCNQVDPETRLDFDNPENANLYGTLEMITTRLEQAMGADLNDINKDEIIHKYLKQTESVKIKVLEGLKKFNCDNQNGRNANQALTYYLNSHPSTIHTAIDEQIKARSETNKPKNTEIKNNE